MCVNTASSPIPAGSRRGIRRSVTLDCELVSGRGDAPVGCLATDLSQNGIWLATQEPVRAGEVVVVCFEPNDGWSRGELMVFAEVARVITTRPGRPGGGMGLEFSDLGDADGASLLEWLAQRKMPVPRRRRPMPRRPRADEVPTSVVPNDRRPVVSAAAAVAPRVVSAPRVVPPPVAYRPPAVWR